MIWVYFLGLLLLTTISCSQGTASENSIRMRRSNANVRTGEIIELDTEDKKVLKMAKSSFRKYADRVGLIYEQFNLLVIKATQQLTTGMIYKLDFYAKPIIYCNPKHPSICQLKIEPLYILNCHSQIKSRPWLNKKDDIRVNCKNEYPIGKY